MNTTSESVGVVGALARALVHSLARAGRPAWAVDLFGDRDLKRIAPVVQCPIHRYPDAIPTLAKQFPPGPVLYTGGLENHPTVIAELAATRELWGNPPDVLLPVRDPLALGALLAASGLEQPRVLPPGEACPAAGRWLMKSRRSSGGLGVRAAKAEEVPDADSYLQEFVAGPSMSAVFVVHESGAELIGVTEQLIGTHWLHARGFHYAGNIGPINVSQRMERELTVLGELLATVMRLRGICGVDFMERADAVCVVEVNPRYPASVEILEHAREVAVFRDPPEGCRTASSPSVVGKAIYYAAQRIAFPAAGPWDGDLTGAFDPWRLPNFADIPDAGSVVDVGWPVLAILTGGSSPAAVRERLQSRASELNALFAESRP